MRGGGLSGIAKLRHFPLAVLAVAGEVAALHQQRGEIVVKKGVARRQANRLSCISDSIVPSARASAPVPAHLEHSYVLWLTWKVVEKVFDLIKFPFAQENL